MVTFKILGLKELQHTFQKMTFEGQRTAITKLLRAAAEPIRSRIEAHARIGPDAPHLFEHIVTRAATSVKDEDFGGRRLLESHEFAVTVGPTSDYFYGYFLEHGTVKMRAYPFMRPGFDEGQDEALRILRDGVMPIVAQVTRAAAGGTGTL
jgi:HK97 gp10 family phage protein